MDNSNFSILIVDDEPDLLEVMGFQVESLGYTIHTANNGNEALEALSTKKVDVVISDVQMPNGSGLELITNAKAKFGDKPVFIFISGLLDSNRREVINAGAFDYLEKPASFNDIKATIERALDKA